MASLCPGRKLGALLPPAPCIAPSAAPAAGLKIDNAVLAIGDFRMLPAPLKIFESRLIYKYLYKTFFPSERSHRILTHRHLEIELPLAVRGSGRAGGRIRG